MTCRRSWVLAGHVIEHDVGSHADVFDGAAGYSGMWMSSPRFISDTVILQIHSVSDVQLKDTTLPPAPTLLMPTIGPRLVFCMIAGTMSPLAWSGNPHNQHRRLLAGIGAHRIAVGFW
jgi:hypothetical protein